MPISVSWFDSAQTIILVRYRLHFDWAEYDRAEQKAAQLMDSSPGRVDVLVDYQPLVTPLDYARHMPRLAATSPYIHHPKLGNVVVCSPTRFIRLMLQTFDSLFNPHRGTLHYSPSLEDGIALIAQMRETHRA